MKILITGGAGFVGSQLAQLFREDLPQASIVVLDNLKRRGSETNLSKFKKLNIEFVHGDIRNPEDFSALPGPFDLMIEASAEPSVLAGLSGSPAYVIQTNLQGTLNCLEYARQSVGKTVFLSTSRVYSVPALRSIPLRESPTRFDIDSTQAAPGLSTRGISESFSIGDFRSFYGTSKLASEFFIQEYAQSYGVKAIINRCGVIAGPGQFGKSDQGVFTLWMARHHFKGSLKYTGFGGEGKQVRDILHPRDLYRLIQRELGVEKLWSASVFNAGGGNANSISLQELSRLCEEITGNKISISSDKSTNDVDIPYYVSDNSLVEKTLDWRPQVKLPELFQDIHAWMKNNEETVGALFR